MLQALRNRPLFGMLLIGFIAFVFVFFGVYTPRVQQANFAGSVNGEPITQAEFGRQFRQEQEKLRSYGLQDEQIKMFLNPMGVFNQIVSRKLMIGQADRLSMAPAKSELRESIGKLPYFLKDGKFDIETYKQTLNANQMTPASFEGMMREDLKIGLYREMFHPMALVSEDDVQTEWQLANTARKFRYILIPLDVATKLKEKKIGDGDLLAALSSEAKANALLAPYKVKAQTTEWVTLKDDGLPTVREATEPVRDAFSGKLAGAKKYDLIRGTLYIQVTDSKDAKGKTPPSEEYSKLRHEIENRRQQDYATRYLQSVFQKSKVEKNEAMLKSYAGGEG